MSREFADIAFQASSLAKMNTKTDWDAVALNLFLIPATLGALHLSTVDKKHLETQPMPDSWCDSVSELPNVSKKGLDLLSKELAAKGFVSVAAANRFVDIEKTALAKRRKKLKRSDNLKNQGAAKLLARAEKELPGSVQAFINTSKDIGSAMSGVAEFSIEKTLLVGEGMKKASTFLQGIRQGITDD